MQCPRVATSSHVDHPAPGSKLAGWFWQFVGAEPCSLLFTLLAHAVNEAHSGKISAGVLLDTTLRLTQLNSPTIYLIRLSVNHTSRMIENLIGIKCLLRTKTPPPSQDTRKPNRQTTLISPAYHTKFAFNGLLLPFFPTVLTRLWRREVPAGCQLLTCNAESPHILPSYPVGTQGFSIP